MIIILMGSNLGDRVKFFLEAEKRITHDIGRILIKSSIYETQPWGFDHKNEFLNQVVGLESEFPTDKVLDALLTIENQMGRKREEGGYTTRNIDLDLLFYDSFIINTTKLILPHPRLHLRKFTLVPLNEIFPTLVHPVLNMSISQILKNCSDPLRVRKFKP